MGQVPPCGTGDSQIFIDEEKLMNIPEWEDDDEYEENEIMSEYGENDCNLEFDREFQLIEEFR